LNALLIYPIFSQAKLFKVFELYRVFSIKKTGNPFIDAFENSPVFFFYEKINNKPLISYGQVIRYQGIKRDKNHKPTNISKLINYYNEHFLKNDKIALHLKGYEEKPTKRECYFGHHLLSEYPNVSNVIVVESPKTAIIATAYYGLPNEINAIFLAIGGNSLKQNYLSKIAHKRIIAIPDSSNGNKFLNDWSEVLISRSVANHVVIDIHAPAGYDLADLIIEKKPINIHNYLINNDKKNFFSNF